MPTNRHLVDNNELVHAPIHLDRGWTAVFGFGKSFVVDEGRVAVITEGGAYIETLYPGTHALSQFAPGRELKAIFVETRELTLTVSTAREFTISRPVPVAINLDVAVTYRVNDFRRVVCEVKYPVTELYDRVILAVRSAVTYSTYDEIRTQGEGIAATTLERLKEAHLPTLVGVEVLSARVIRLQALDTAGDALAGQAFNEYVTVRDWMVNNQITSNSQVTWPWLVQNRPEVAQQLLKMYGGMAEKMIDSGALDASAFLNQSSGNSTPQVNNPLLDFSQFGLPSPFAHVELPSESKSALDETSIITARKRPDLMERMREEVTFLKDFPNAQVNSELTHDLQGIPNAFLLQVTVPLKMRGELILYFACSTNYPASKPNIEIEVDGDSVPFESEILRTWSGQYLLEIVREAKKQFEY